jgi:hypothetical protein
LGGGRHSLPPDFPCCTFKNLMSAAISFTYHILICFQSLLSLLLSQHTKLKEQISEVLDADLIRQQAEKGILDFQVSDETELLFLSETATHPLSLIFIFSNVTYSYF